MCGYISYLIFALLFNCENEFRIQCSKKCVRQAQPCKSGSFLILMKSAKIGMKWALSKLGKGIINEVNVPNLSPSPLLLCRFFHLFLRGKNGLSPLFCFHGQAKKLCSERLSVVAHWNHHEAMCNSLTHSQLKKKCLFPIVISPFVQQTQLHHETRVVAN